MMMKLGGGKKRQGKNYRDCLGAGSFTKTGKFGAKCTGAVSADDMQKGIIERFRSHPMARTGVLRGRTASDVVYNFLSILVMAATGYLVGWREIGRAHV